MNLIKNIKSWYERMWENTTGPFWQIKWKILDSVNSKRKYKLYIPELDQTWSDKDHILFLACFRLLVKFWEEEEPERFIEIDEEMSMLKSLYLWYTQIRPKRIEPFNKKYFENIKEPTTEEMWQPDETDSDLFVLTVDQPEFKEYWNRLDLAQEVENIYLEEDQRMLEKLIKNRSAMWC